MKIRPVGAQLFLADGQMDRQRERRRSFRNFANAPKMVFKKWEMRGMDWTYLAWDRDGSGAFVSAVMNLVFHNMRGIP